MISKDCENCDCLEENKQLKQRVNLLSDEISAQGIVIEGYQDRNQKLFDENEQLKQFIKELTTKGTGRIDLASGYSYNTKAILRDFNIGDVE